MVGCSLLRVVCHLLCLRVGLACCVFGASYVLCVLCGRLLFVVACRVLRVVL